MSTPTTLDELIEALTSLPSLDPVERARLCPLLDKAATVILAATRVVAMAEATTGPGRLSKTELGRRLGISRETVHRRLQGMTTQLSGGLPPGAEPGADLDGNAVGGTGKRGQRKRA